MSTLSVFTSSTVNLVRGYLCWPRANLPWETLLVDCISTAVSYLTDFATTSLSPALTLIWRSTFVSTRAPFSRTVLASVYITEDSSYSTTVFWTFLPAISFRFTRRVSVPGLVSTRWGYADLASVWKTDVSYSTTVLTTFLVAISFRLALLALKSSTVYLLRTCLVWGWANLPWRT